MVDAPEEEVVAEEVAAEEEVDPAEWEAAMAEANEAVAEEPVAEEAPPEAEAEELDPEVEGVEEHLKEAMEGSLRVKRLLSQDAEMGTDKKRKIDDPEREKKINVLLTTWQLTTDALVRHVLENLKETELQELITLKYCPDRYNQFKSAADLLTRYTCEARERKTAGGGPLDAISTFKFRNKANIDLAGDRKLRLLTHKDLRYVMQNFDGAKPLDEVVEEASAHVPEEESTDSALPDAPGIQTFGRFGRLELIDPLADCAVFGDANLTFSLKLAKHRKGLGHVGRVIATTFEDLPTLRERYKEIDGIIKELEDHYAEVYHCVDCTRIAIDPQFEGMEGTLGAVYYNFPHSGAVNGFFDGHPVVNWRHENLMRLFFRALRTFVKPGGIVKVSSNMGAVGVRYSYIVGGAVENEFTHVETIPFLEWHMHRYGRSYGDRRDSYKRPDAEKNQSYNAQRAESDMVYSFCYAPSGEKLAPQGVRLPPTLNTLVSCTDGPFKNLMGTGKESLAKQLHKRFVTECSGTHVG